MKKIYKIKKSDLFHNTIYFIYLIYRIWKDLVNDT